MPKHRPSANLPSLPFPKFTPHSTEERKKERNSKRNQLKQRTQVTCISKNPSSSPIKERKGWSEQKGHPKRQNNCSVARILVHLWSQSHWSPVFTQAHPRTTHRSPGESNPPSAHPASNCGVEPCLLSHKQTTFST